jgi:hypothetical protein
MVSGDYKVWRNTMRTVMERQTEFLDKRLKLKLSLKLMHMSSMSEKSLMSDIDTMHSASVKWRTFMGSQSEIPSPLLSH